MTRRLSLACALIFSCATSSLAIAALPHPRPRPDEMAAPTTIRSARPTRAQTTDLGTRIDANQISMAVTNIGSFAWDLTTGNAGLEFPKGSGLTAGFAGGLWLGAQVGFETRVTVSEYSSEYQPGSMIAGVPDDPESPRYRVFKLHRTYATTAERDAALADYLQNAVPSGAPLVGVLPDGSLDITGDQMLWCVFNDANPFVHYARPGGTTPLGLEVQQTLFAFDRPGPLGQTVFLRYKILNKGSNLLEGLKVGLWMDPDLGDPVDDLVGCAPDRNLGFAYNVGSDARYGANPPALGLDLISGPTIPEIPHVPLTAFSSYVNGTDPQSALASYTSMQGLNPGGIPMVDPVTQLPTTFAFPGDPRTGKGWLDPTPADKRMLLTTDAYELAPGSSQEVTYALIVGSGGSDLRSLAQVFCDESAIDDFAAAGFTGPAPDAEPCPLPPSCPLSANEWEQRYDANPFDPTLQFIAQCVDDASLTLSFQWSADGLRQILASSNLATPAGAAAREYAALLANSCAARYGLPASDPIVLRPGDPVACSGIEAENLRELTETAVRGVAGTYLDVPPNFTALQGIDWGGSGFGGGAGAMIDFLGNGPDPLLHPAAFPDVELRFDAAHPQLAYRYLRLEQVDGSPPVGGREYRYGGFHTVPFTAWDVTHGVQLDVAFAERAITDPDGNLLPPDQQLATFDETWGPINGDLGGREYLFITDRPYDGVPKADLEVNGALLDVPETFTYVLWSELRFFGSVIDDGDRFAFRFGFRPSRGVDTRLSMLAEQPQDDPGVVAAYGSVTECLRDLSGELSCCHDTQAPTLGVVLSPATMFPPNHSLQTIHATVTSQDHCDAAPRIRLVSITSDEPDAGTGPEDVPGDVQGAALGTADLEFQLRAERSDSGDGRTYTVCYEAEDASGNVTQTCATVNVPHDRRGRAGLSLASGTWTLTIYGDPTIPARSVQAGSVRVATASLQVAASGSPIYVDADHDRQDDAVFTLQPGLSAAEVARGPTTARWTSDAAGYTADISPGSVTDVQGAAVSFSVTARPNPGRGESTLFYSIPREGVVRMTVFDVTGRQVARLVDGRVAAGRHAVSFRPRVPQLYLYRLEWEGKRLKGRLAIVR